MYTITKPVKYNLSATGFFVKTLGMFTSIFILGTASPATADIKPAITFDYYLIQGESLEELANVMSEKGPEGYWALTNWQINWSDDCAVEAIIRIEFPKLIGRSRLTESELQTFDNMLIALKSHELQHAYFSAFAADEIARNECIDAEAISDYWSRKQKEFDARTDHGYREGVSLD